MMWELCIEFGNHKKRFLTFSSQSSVVTSKGVLWL